MVSIAVIAHNVSAPLHKHRSKEFSERMYFMAKRFDEVHILSKERYIGHKKNTIKDEIFPNLIIHRIHDGLISSNLDVLKIVSSLGIDAIFADGIEHGASSILCKKRQIPLITFAHGHEADLKAIWLKLKLGLKPTPGILSKIFALYDSIVLRTSDKILCVSLGLVEDARSLLPKKDWVKVKLIPQSLQYVNHISKEAAIWADELVGSLKATKEAGFYLLIVIGVGPSKGTDIALKTLKYLLKKRPHTAMIVVGKRIDPIYKKEADELNLQANILFLENLPRDYVLALLSKCSVLILPSFSEGFSRAMCEAMALGVPVVAFANKSLREAVKEEAVVAVSTTNPQDYAKECISLFRDEKFREEVSQRAKDYIRPFLLFSERKRLTLICDSINQVISARR